MGTHIKYFFFSLLLVIFQTKLVVLLSLGNITPDVLTIWIVYVALREGQFSSTVWGFGVGLFFDLVTGNFIGLSALTKTICGFIAGFFYNENKTAMTLRSYRFIVIVLVVSLVHNTLYFVIFTQGTDIGLIRAVFEFGIATTAYTSVISLLPMFMFARKYAG
ncbi:MAG TPA: rod shape-determining protein MreD [Bacteroidota bacterium]|jgi:rod shape-determining protein MreD|nr:rod shape-determining protein MreD [Bacteroidota bacterium]